MKNDPLEIIAISEGGNSPPPMRNFGEFIGPSAVPYRGEDLGGGHSLGEENISLEKIHCFVGSFEKITLNGSDSVAKRHGSQLLKKIRSVAQKIRAKTSGGRLSPMTALGDASLRPQLMVFVVVILKKVCFFLERDGKKRGFEPKKTLTQNVRTCHKRLKRVANVTTITNPP